MKGRDRWTDIRTEGQTDRVIIVDNMTPRLGAEIKITLPDTTSKNILLQVPNVFSLTLFSWFTFTQLIPEEDHLGINVPGLYSLYTLPDCPGLKTVFKADQSPPTIISRAYNAYLDLVRCGGGLFKSLGRSLFFTVVHKNMT